MCSSDLPLQQIGEKGMLRLPLAVGHHLHRPLARGSEQASGLQFHQQAPTAEAARGARHQDTDRSKAGGVQNGNRDEATQGWPESAREHPIQALQRDWWSGWIGVIAALAVGCALASPDPGQPRMAECFG